MNILVFEPSFKGHHLNYLYIILSAFKDKNNEVTLLTLDINQDSPSLKEIAQISVGKIKIRYIRLNKILSLIYFGPKLYYKEAINYFIVRKYLSRQKQNILFDLIFFPYVDGLARLLSLVPNPFYGMKWTGISMVPTFHLKKMGLNKVGRNLDFLEEWVFLRLLKKKHLTKIFTIDLPLHQYITFNYPGLEGKIKYIADPVELPGQVSRDTSRQYFDLELKSMVLLLYGYISDRKGVIELLKLVQHKDFPKNLKVVIAGVQEESIKTKISNLHIQKFSHRIHFINRFISKEEEYMILKASDIVWCAYKNFYSMSSVLVHAAAMGKPVIACKEGVISWFTSKYEIGELVDVSDEESLLSAVRKLLNNKELYEKYTINAKQIGAMHTVEKFKETIIKEVKI